MTKLILCLLGILPVMLQAQEIPSGVYIKSIGYQGNGCPQGTVVTNLAADQKAFTLTFSNYAVETDIPERRRLGFNQKFCNIRAGLVIPKGWSYSLLSVDYRGYASLEEKTFAVQRSLISFGGILLASFGEYKMKGPIDENFQFRGVAPVRNLAWSPCSNGGAAELPVNIFSVIMILGQKGLVTTDSVDGEVHQYGMTYRKCTPGQR